MEAPAKPGHPEVFDLRKLSPDGAELDQPLAAAWLDAELNDPEGSDDLTLVAKGDGHLALRLEWVDPLAQRLTLRLKGHATAQLTTHCVRCLADVEIPIDVSLDTTLMAEDEMREDAGELELSTEDLEEVTYRDMSVDVPRMIREAVLLELDMNPTCEDEEACEARTQELISSAVPAEPEAVDPRWAPLLALKQKGA
ncbi:MAG: DUF177 domain-containing protein [Deltaproteobacteria bacterium]|nr:DUF177 domain-containing protein [Deltaproteobacteria bacterium]